MKVPCVISIAGSDSGGGAGIQADIKTFAALGVHGLCVLTAVTAQNTLGVDASYELPPELVTQQLDTLMKDFDVKFAKTGMLYSAEIIRAVEVGSKKHGLNLVVDPVMYSTTKSRLLREDALDALRRLIARAELVTPNIPEAERLAGMRVRTRGDMKKAARAIASLGPRAVLVKGGHLKSNVVTDLLYTDGRFEEFCGPRIDAGSLHGAGCSFSSAITAELAKGAELRTAILSARTFLAKAIDGRLEVGRGARPVNQMSELLQQANGYRAIVEVWRASQMLVSNPKFVELIPEVGSNITMALPGAKSRSDVCGLSGRIVRSGRRAVVTGFPELGGSKHVADVVITAMKFDPSIRAAMNIRYSPEIIRLCKKLGFVIGTFERRLEPQGVKTMQWGTEQAIKRTGRVPQVIFDRGGVGKEAMVRLLGPSPVDVAKMALQLAEKLS